MVPPSSPGHGAEWLDLGLVGSAAVRSRVGQPEPELREQSPRLSHPVRFVAICMTSNGYELAPAYVLSGLGQMILERSSAVEGGSSATH